MGMDFSYGLKNLHLRVISTNAEAQVTDKIAQVNCADKWEVTQGHKST